MTGRLLDVTELPTDWGYSCQNGTFIGMNDLLATHGEVISALEVSGLIKTNGSYGFALSVPLIPHGDGWEMTEWDTPQKYVAFVGGRGPERNRYVANAVRKLRPCLRQIVGGYGLDGTLAMRLFAPDLFQRGVESQDDNGTFPWGDYPWGGAAVVPLPEFAIAGAISGFSEVQDDTVARVILGSLAEQIIIGDGLLSDD